MIKPIFTIYDQKTREYLHPSMAQNKDVAIRDFYNTLSQVPTMSQHPKDFSLYHIAEFDTESGEISPIQTVQFIITGLNCIESIQQTENQNGLKKDAKEQIGDETPV